MSRTVTGSGSSSSSRTTPHRDASAWRSAPARPTPPRPGASSSRSPLTCPARSSSSPTSRSRSLDSAPPAARRGGRSYWPAAADCCAAATLSHFALRRRRARRRRMGLVRLRPLGLPHARRRRARRAAGAGRRHERLRHGHGRRPHRGAAVSEQLSRPLAVAAALVADDLGHMEHLFSGRRVLVRLEPALADGADARQTVILAVNEILRFCPNVALALPPEDRDLIKDRQRARGRDPRLHAPGRDRRHGEHRLRRRPQCRRRGP